ncbi:hypothetical protein TPA0598_04_03430 [Streptomyces lydicamycinicus]|uniref:Uncharacterized protein n=1 Tax=Streptomyces lydicamycinicus TaxID=1546107 RepID=A0A0N7YLG0_9ACTN|nr:hypothetical protein [Streptomyces lydicamycinicus]GAO08707.1 hypothetical protein TPA0598_04_03430 [Streptomyces lydicamycinicus]
MLEGRRDTTSRIIQPDTAYVPLPVRTPQQAMEQLDARHELEERAPDFFHVPDAPRTWRRLHRVLTSEERVS